MISNVGYESLHEGACVQMLHVGSYATEPETLAHMEHFMAQNQQASVVLIYVSEPRKVESVKMKTILGYPIQAVEVVKG